eukprot:gene10802-14501_t
MAAKKGKKVVKKEETVDSLLEKANNAMATMQIELASTYYRRALTKSDNQNTDIMDALADVSIQLGDVDTALSLLITSTSVAPSQNPFKWMFLAQLQCGSDAVESYRHGIEFISQLVSVEASPDMKILYTKQIAKAYCSLADIFLTDLCDEECAESNCEEAVMMALAADSESLDGLQTLANLRISQNRKPEASILLKTVYGRVSQILSVVSSRTIVQEFTDNDVEPEEMNDIPETEFCIATVKLLIECSSLQPEFTTNAMELIEYLLKIDDDNIELWYLMGVAALNSNSQDAENESNETARYYLERALAMMDELKESEEFSKDNFPYEDQYKLVNEHLKILNDMTGSNNGNENNINNNENGNIHNNIILAPLEDEEWSDVEDDDDNKDVMES